MRALYFKRKSQYQSNGRVKAGLMLVLLCLISVSCVKQINLYQADDDEKKEENNNNNVPDDPVIVDRIEDLKIKSLTLRPEENEFIYGNVNFESNSDKTVWTATINDYQADLSQLKVVFKAVADHITVGDVKQVSGETVNDFRKEVVFRLYTTNNEHQWRK